MQKAAARSEVGGEDGRDPVDEQRGPQVEGEQVQLAQVGGVAARVGRGAGQVQESHGRRQAGLVQDQPCLVCPRTSVVTIL